MPESREAVWLRLNWNEEHFGRFNHKWIAVRGQEIIAYSDDLNVIMNDYNIDRSESPGERPLYAFVYFGELQ
jgi:hypothetical protein